jgi:hypothetical protein
MAIASRPAANILGSGLRQPSSSEITQVEK